ncbi:protein rolling stone-like [Actinia tenebrosa]|uniref:Protein rolling stone-like n=1 Tax=Actinia tenebrosa TaxID=6105 RepID=A0A6P8IA00_ACTTE|nr:protein rolling stone-like [Actinia tenebrosa]
MLQGIRDEVRLRHFFPSHADFSTFTTSKWISPSIYLAYRWVVAIYMSIDLILDRLYFGRWYSSAFTMWGLITVTLYFDLSAVMCSVQYYLQKNGRSSVAITTPPNYKDADTLYSESEKANQRNEVHPRMILLLKLMWILFNIAAVNSMIVTIGYWGLLHSKFGQKSLVGRIGYHNITAHLLNGVLMLLDVMLVPFPVRILHCVYSTIYGFLYVFATLIHWLASRKTKKFYDFLDYTNNPGLAAITVCICFFVIHPLFQLLLYFLYRFREWLLTKCVRLNPPKDTVKELHCVA